MKRWYDGCHQGLTSDRHREAPPCGSWSALAFAGESVEIAPVARLRLSFALLLLLWTTPAWGQKPFGVWTGKLGRAPIVACFEKGSASYYYVKYGADILLVEQKKLGTWEEKKEAAGQAGSLATGTWQLSPPENDALHGVWTSPDGKRSLPIALRASPEQRESPCLSPEYEAPRVAAFVRIPDEETSMGGLRLRTFHARDIDITGLEIVGKSAQLAGLGRFVEKLNLGLRDQYLECVGSAAEREGWHERVEYTGIVKLESVTEHFVVLRQSAAYFCAGAHPDSDFTYFVVDRKSGEEISIGDWLEQPLAAIGRRYWKNKRADCKDALDEDTTFAIWPSPAGMVIAPRFPHAIDACSEEETIPYARLARQLTPAGKRAVAEFVRAASSPKPPGAGSDK